MLESLTAPLYRQLADFEGKDCDWPSCASVPKVIKLAFAAETDVEAMCQRVVPLLLEGHVAVVVLLFRGGRRLQVGLLALMGVMAECLPPGVLNLISGLGLEAGIALLNSSRVIPPSELPSRVEQISDAVATRRDCTRAGDIDQPAHGREKYALPTKAKSDACWIGASRRAAIVACGPQYGKAELT